MPSKYYLRNFQAGHFYHIFNRGAAKQKIFYTEKDYNTFTSILSHYLLHPQGSPPSYLTRINNPGKFNPVVQIQNLSNCKDIPLKLVVYCLMPNHFHLLIKQETSDKQLNISNLMRRLSITYSMYMNSVQKKSGALFQGRFKSVHVATDEQLLYLSKYIHSNPKNKFGRINLEKYQHSSFPTYISIKKQKDWLYISEILNLRYFHNSINSKKSYKKFVHDSTNMNEEFQQ